MSYTFSSTNEKLILDNIISTYGAGSTVSAVKSDSLAANVLTYVIATNNTGSDTINNVTILDTIPIGTTYVPGSALLNGNPISGNPTPPTGINIGTISAGLTSTLSFKVLVSITIPREIPVLNSATVRYVENSATKYINSNITSTDITNASFLYANPYSGLLAGAIGWISPKVSKITSSGLIQNLTAIFKDGSIFTFDLSVTNISGNSTSINITNPVNQFGSIEYTGLGNVALYSDTLPSDGNNIVSINNINFKDPYGNNVPNFFFYVANAGNTSSLDELQINSGNGKKWSLFTTIGNTANITITGLNTDSVTLQGNYISQFAAPILVTTNPTSVSVNLVQGSSGGIGGISFGVSMNKLIVNKVITNRLDASDQFNISITGIESATTTTYGTSYGTQPVSAYIFSPTIAKFTIQESMTSLSASTMQQYNSVVQYYNLIVDGTVVPTNSTLPSIVSVGSGDIIVATITNQILVPTVSTSKIVDKNISDTAAVLTYTIPITNNGTITINNVTIIDTIPIGTTFVPNSVALNGSYIPGNPAPPSGVNIGTIAAGITATVSFQVLVGNTIPSPNPVTNSAVINYSVNALPTILTEASNTNIISTLIMNTNFLKVTLGSSLSYATCEDHVVYTATVVNTGILTALNVVLKGTIPNGLTLIPDTVNVDGTTIPGASIQMGVNLGDVGAGASSVVKFSAIITCG